MNLRMFAGDNTRVIRGDIASVRTWVFELHVDDIDLPMTDRERELADRMRAEIESYGYAAPIGLQLLELALHACAVERALGPGRPMLESGRDRLPGHAAVVIAGPGHALPGLTALPAPPRRALPKP